MASYLKTVGHFWLGQLARHMINDETEYYRQLPCTLVAIKKSKFKVF